MRWVRLPFPILGVLCALSAFTPVASAQVDCTVTLEYLNAGAVVDGFTIEVGYTRSGADCAANDKVRLTDAVDGTTVTQRRTGGLDAGTLLLQAQANRATHIYIQYIHRGEILSQIPDTPIFIAPDALTLVLWNQVQALENQVASLTAIVDDLSADEVTQQWVTDHHSTATISWSQLDGVPVSLLDGDDDTQLTEAEVDAYVANNDYANEALVASEEARALAAEAILQAALNSLVTELNDGDSDTTPVGWLDIHSRPDGLDDGDDVAAGGGMTWSDITDLPPWIDEAITLLNHIEINGVMNGVVGPNIVFSDANVHFVSGSGATNSAVNGLGNVIVGYNEPHDDDPLGGDRTGSHNLIVGDGHSYTSFGGFVAGYSNSVRAQSCSVTGGQENEALDNFSSVSGGTGNVASGFLSSVSGGERNTASGWYSSVSGGSLNRASGDQSSVSGGQDNYAWSDYSSILGGELNTAGNVGGRIDLGPFATVSGGSQNVASGYASSVSAGRTNDASGAYSSVSAGYSNLADGSNSSVSGGGYNEASHDSSVSGGRYNVASGSFSSVSGGSYNEASGSFSSVSGGGSQLVNQGNVASGVLSSVSGGTENEASGLNSSVSGGQSNASSGMLSSVLGGGNNNAATSKSCILGSTNRTTTEVSEIAPWPITP